MCMSDGRAFARVRSRVGRAAGVVPSVRTRIALARMAARVQGASAREHARRDTGSRHVSAPPLPGTTSCAGALLCASSTATSKRTTRIAIFVPAA